MNQTIIIGILIKDRIKEADRTLKVLSKHASVISSRLGFHEVTENICSRVGFVLLHITANEEKWMDLFKELSNIGGIEVQIMKF